MAFTFDTLGFAKRLRESGVPFNQAEAHAEAARDFVMQELVTKTDMRAAMDALADRLTIRLGGIVVVGVAVLGAILKLT